MSLFGHTTESFSVYGIYSVSEQVRTTRICVLSDVSTLLGRCQNVTFLATQPKTSRFIKFILCRNNVLTTRMYVIF